MKNGFLSAMAAVLVVFTALLVTACGGQSGSGNEHDGHAEEIQQTSGDLTPGDDFLCLMHPEIKSGSPEKCTICKMDLHPRTDYPTDGDAYFCPMHPEITSGTPGRCTKCAMKLVPKGDSSDTLGDPST